MIFRSARIFSKISMFFWFWNGLGSSMIQQAVWEFCKRDYLIWHNRA